MRNLALLLVALALAGCGSATTTASTEDAAPAATPDPTELAEKALLAKFNSPQYKSAVGDFWRSLNSNYVGLMPTREFIKYLDEVDLPKRNTVSCVQASGNTFACEHTVRGDYGKHVNKTTVEATYDAASDAVVITSELTEKGEPFPG